MYDVRIGRQAERGIRRADATMRRRLMTAILALGEEPRPNGCRKLRGTTDDYRIRVGGWRVLYSVDDTVHVVDVVWVGPRGGAY